MTLASVASADQPDDAGEPDTPCVGVCSTGFDDVCRGCLRTAAEVGRWVEMSPAKSARSGRAFWPRAMSRDGVIEFSRQMESNTAFPVAYCAAASRIPLLVSVSFSTLT
jgi:Predicted Fe-S protein